MVWTGSDADKRASKRKREKNFLIGLCVNCGKNKRPEGKRVCRECIIKGYAARKPLIAKKISEGICSNCLGRPAKPHRRLCEVCTERSRNNNDSLFRRCKKRGITVEQYKAMFDNQSGLCALCGDPNLKRKRSLAIDHCHKTGVVRGLLCHVCNTGLGALKDDTELLLRAIAYIKKFQFPGPFNR